MTRPPSSGPDDFDPLDPSHWPAPPEPSEARWAEVYQGFAGGVPARRPWWKVGAAAGAVAASVLIAWAAWPRPAQPTPPQTQEPVAESPADPLAEYDVLPIATDEGPGDEDCQSGTPGVATVIIPFTDPTTLGKFVYHCHIGEHEDNGMMATIEVREPDGVP